MNNDFKSMYMARNSKTAAAGTPETLGVLRRDANALWYTLRDKVSGYYQVMDGAAPWSTIVSQVNALIDQYNDLLASRPVKSNTPANQPA